MRIYSVRGPDGRIYDIQGPDNATDQQVIAALQSYLNQQGAAPPAPTPAAPQEESGFLRQAADVPVQFATGIATGVRLISDAFGADNPVSQNIRGVEDYLQGLLSAQAKNDQQEIARIMKEAEDKGIAANLVAAVQAFGTAPVDFIAQAAGTAAPTIAGGLAAQLLKAPALLASTGIGSVMGAGTVKSSIYDEVKQTLTQLGASPEEAERRAVLAQEYGGENLDQILLGTVVGGVAGRFGIEPAVAKQIAGEIGRKTIGKAAVQEALPEAAQGFQEQVAQNIALQREGQEVPTFRGAVGAGALEALAGAGVGGLGEVAMRRLGAGPEPEVTPEVTPEATRAPEPTPEVTPEATAPDWLRQELESVTTPEQAETAVRQMKGQLKSLTSVLSAPDKLSEAAARNNVEPAVQAERLQGAVGEIQTRLPFYERKLQELIAAPPPPSREQLLAEFEEVEPAPEGETAQKFESVVDKIRSDRPAVKPTATLEEESVVDYDALEAEQNRVLQQTLATADIEEGPEVSATTAPAPVEVKPRGRRKRAAAPVSGEPVSAAEAATPGTLLDGVGNVTDATNRSVVGGGERTPALEKQTVETPQERYESVLRRIEGLASARRATPIIVNRLRTQARQGNPAKNPEGYELVLKQAEEILNRFEDTAEKIESDESARGLDLREQRLKAQENVALDRAQRQIEQDRVANSLRDSYDRKLSDEEILPKYALEMRDALEGNDLKTVTQLLVDKRAAVDMVPKRMEAYRPVFTAVARKLNGVDFANVKVQTEATPGANLEIFKRLKDERKYAEYDPADNTLYIRRDKINGGTVMHELVHAGTVQVLRQYEVDKSKLTPEQRLGAERLIGVYDLVMQQTGDISLVREYEPAFDSVYEFVAYGMTSPMFQARLARIEVPMPVGRKNLWTEFVKAVANMFGVTVKSTDGVSALDEVGQAFSEILAAPVEGGVTGVSPLAAKKAEKEPKPKIDPFKQTEERQSALRTNRLTFSGLVKHLTSAESVEELVRNYQDRQRPLLALQRDLDRADLAIWASGQSGGNTLAAANDESAGRYDNNEKVIAPKIENLNKAVSAYQARTGRDFNSAMARLDTFFTAETSDQRRLTNYLKEKPLKTTPSVKLKGSDKLISYAQLRDMLIDSVQTTQELDDGTRDAIYKRLLQLGGVEIGPDGKPRKSADADKYADPLGASYGQLDRKGEARKPGKRPVDYEDPYYDIIQDWDYETNNEVLREMAQEMKLYGNEIKAVREALIELDKVTQRFNAEANHLTQPAKNLIKLYGWDKYVPLMGKVKANINKKDQFVYLNTVPNEFLPGFRGRETAPDSPILMTQVNAGKSATRAARADIVPTLVNLIKPHPKTKKQYVKGEMVGTIKFNDRYKGEVNFEETDGKGGKKWVGKDKFYNYLPNGDIEVWRVDDPKIIESLRPEWEPPKGLVGRVLTTSQAVTSIIGQGHTRYQLKFAIYDFPRNVFANAGAIFAELGASNAAKYMAGIGNQVFVRLRIPQVWRIANAHYNGDFEAIKKIGGYNPKTDKWRDTFVRDAYRYLERGGRVSIVRSWQTRNKLEELIDEANKSDIRKDASKYKAALDKIFDLWMDGFELVARVEGYRIAKSYAENERKMSVENSELYGVSFAKNFANFEKKGVAKAPAALYAFWNPSATGAVRAFDAIMPAFRDPKKVLDELPAEIKDDAEAKAAYFDRYVKLKRNAQMAMAFYGGVGYMMYMMALSLGGMGGDDDQENAVASDNKELWTRNARIPLGWLGIDLKEKYFQIPWGFGLGAFAAVGAQVASQVSAAVSPTKEVSLKDFLGNTASIAADSYMPLPFARYNIAESPFNWIISSLMPSALRPFYEYNVNMSGLGQSIYRDYYNRYGPAYAGSENIEEAYRYAAEMASEATDGRIQKDPSEIRYIATAYLDGIASMAADIVNLGLVAKGAKDFDPKTDLIILDSFIGNKISPSLIEFNKARERLDVLKRGYDTAINSPNAKLRESFLKNNPNAPGIVAMYNQQISALREFREATVVGEIYADTPKERKEYKKEMNKIRDLYMDQVGNLYKTYEDDIDDYYQITPRILPN